MVDAQDLKSCDPFGSCGFESLPRHHGVWLSWQSARFARKKFNRGVAQLARVHALGA